MRARSEHRQRDGAHWREEPVRGLLGGQGRDDSNNMWERNKSVSTDFKVHKMS
jgi:hypothetical protein